MISENAKFVRLNGEPKLFHVVGFKENKVIVKRRGNSQRVRHCKLTEITGEVVEAIRDSNSGYYEIGDLFEVGSRYVHDFSESIEGSVFRSQNFKVVQVPKMNIESKPATPPAKPIAGDYVRFKDSPEIYRLDRYDERFKSIVHLARSGVEAFEHFDRIEKVEGEVVEVVQNSILSIWPYKIGDLLEVAKRDRKHNVDWIYFVGGEEWDAHLFRTVQQSKAATATPIAHDEPATPPVEPGSHLSKLDKSEAKHPSQQEPEPQELRRSIMGYIICETATGNFNYHLRVTDSPKYSGGPNIVSLCGKTMGWDTKIPISSWNRTTQCNEVYCEKCLEIANKEIKTSKEPKLESPPDKSEAKEPSQPSEKPLKDRKFVRCIDDSNSRILVKGFYYELNGEIDRGRVFLQNLSKYAPWDHSRFEPVEILGWAKRIDRSDIYPVVNFEPFTIIQPNNQTIRAILDMHKIIEDYRHKAKPEPVAREQKPQKPAGVPVQVKVVKACPGLTEGKVYDAIRQGDGRYYIERNDDGVPFADNYRHRSGWTKFEKYVKCVGNTGAQEFLKIDSAYPVIFEYEIFQHAYEISEGDIGVMRRKWRFTDFNHSLVKEYRSMFSRIATLFRLAKSAAVFVAFAVTAATCWAIYQLNMGQLTGTQLEESAISLGNEISPYLLYTKEGWGYLRELGPLGAIGIAAAYVKRNWKTLLRNGLAAIEVTSDEAKK